MKFSVLLIAVVSVNFSFSQETRNILRFEYKFIQDLWKPYSEEGAIYQDSTGNISSDSRSINLHTTVISKPKWNFNAGLTLKRINFKIEDRIHAWNYTRRLASLGQLYIDTNYRVFNDPADFNATSTSIGIILEGNYELFRTGMLIGSMGLDVETYLYEKYDSWYSSDDFTPSDYPESIPQTGSGPRKKLFLSSVNTSIYYRTVFYPNDYYDLGLKISLGGNVLSDWNQFRQHIWVGLGLELSLNNGWSSK